MKVMTPIIACLAFLAAPASACMSTNEHSAYIHDALPTPLPIGAFIAEVDLQLLPEQLRQQQDWREVMFRRGLHARIRRVVQGEYRGRDLVVRPTQLSSCDNIFGNGHKGLLVGIPRGLEHGTLVVDPITADSWAGYRLPDGFHIDAKRAARGALPLAVTKQGSRSWSGSALLLGIVAAAFVGAAAFRAFTARRRRSDV